MGGVPYYWTKLEPSKSMGQNINDLFFKEGGELHNEFNFIYASMFKSPEKYVKRCRNIIRQEIRTYQRWDNKKGKLDSSGQLSSILEDLIECGFIRKYCHLDKRLRDAIYQLVDCYTLFYYQFVRMAHGVDDEYWTKLLRTPLIILGVDWLLNVSAFSIQDRLRLHLAYPE